MLVVDDHVAVREGLRVMITAAIPGVQVHQADSPAMGMRVLSAGAVDMVVLDLCFEGRAILETIAQIKETQPSARILVYTMHQDIQIGVRAIRAGADGYLTKELPSEEVLSAIRMVASGRRYISAVLAEALADFVASQSSSRTADHRSLSDREFEVLCLLVAGKAPIDISVELCMSVKTVSTYRSRMLRKLGLENTAQLIRYALEHKLVPDPVSEPRAW